MFLIPSIVLSLLLLFVILKINNKDVIYKSIAIIVVSFVITTIIYAIDLSFKTTDTEVWSGNIESVNHKEEYDEWIPPVTETHTDSKGNTYTTTTPGYWEHHDAENIIETSDNGSFHVKTSISGIIKFNDSYPNTDKELQRYYPIGLPTSSTHRYKNKVQASYSIYNHKNIDIKKYKDKLPKYPDEMVSPINVKRLIGYVPNSNKALLELNKENSYLNKNVPDPEKKGKTKSYKQVNIIYVNLENKPIDYAYALQDYWQGGNKNDFVIVFSMNKKDNTIKWVYPFSWADSNKSELLKIQVRNYLLDKQNIKDFVPIEKDISKMIEKNFERKQFKDFNYLTIPLDKCVYYALVIINILLFILYICVLIKRDIQ